MDYVADHEAIRSRLRRTAVTAVLVERDGPPRVVTVLALDDGVPRQVAINVGGEGRSAFELLIDPVVLAPRLLNPVKVPAPPRSRLDA